MINTHWGGVVEDNSFGTHEFFELADQLGTDRLALLVKLQKLLLAGGKGQERADGRYDVS